MEGRGTVQFNRRAAEAVTALVILAAVVALYIVSLSLPPSPMRGYPGPAFIPRMILLFTGIFAVLWLVQLFLGRRRAALLPEDERRFDFAYGGFFVTLAAVAALVLGLDYIGFEITCFAIMLVLLYPRCDNPLMAVFGAFATTATIYVVFALALGVSIPLAFLPNYISF